MGKKYSDTSGTAADSQKDLWSQDQLEDSPAVSAGERMKQ